MVFSHISVGSLDLTQCIVGLLTIPIAYALILANYRLFFHPLSKYPGPLLGRLTSFNCKWQTLQGNSTLARHRWLEQYGDIVRIGPNELIFGDLKPIKEIYGQSSQVCLKDRTFYRPFTLTNNDSLLTVIDKNKHAQMRRLLSHGFARAGVLQFEAQIKVAIEQFLHNVTSVPQPVNVYTPLNHLFLDTVSTLSFGRSFNCLKGEISQAAEDIDRVQNISAVKGMFPWIEWLPTKFVQDSVKARPRVVEFARSCLEDFREKIKSGAAPEGSLLRRMWEAKDAETGDGLTDFELMENATVMIQAGSGTSAPTSQYFLYEVGRRPDIQEKLTREIRDAFPDVSVMPDYDRLDSLPYLNKVFSENLRLRGPLPVNLPRISPGKVIGGQYIPAGTLVSSLAYNSHRRADLFPNPEEFDPERWTNPTEGMKTAFRPFSNGPRNCIGMHLARAQLMLTIGTIYQRYDVKLDPKTTPEKMKGLDRGVTTPIGREVWLHFIPRNQ